MHEFAIAEALSRTILEQCEAHHVLRVTRVQLAAGQQRSVVVDSLTYYLDMLLKGTPAEGAKFDIESVPVMVYCVACEDVYEAPSPWAGCCPVCYLPAEVTSGRELTFISMEAE